MLFESTIKCVATVCPFLIKKMNASRKLKFINYSSVLIFFFFLFICERYNKNEYDSFLYDSIKIRKRKCHLALFGTFPPNKCIVAEFQQNLIHSFLRNNDFNCSFEIFAFFSDRVQMSKVHEKRKKSNQSDKKFENQHSKVKNTKNIAYPVHYVFANVNPHPDGFLKAMNYVNNNKFTNLILHQDFFITTIMWQLLDIARLANMDIKVYTIVHTPIAHPTVEQKSFLKQLSRFSNNMFVMSWYGYHSLIHAYGISIKKLRYFPYGLITKEVTEKFNDRPFAKKLKLKNTEIKSTDFVIFSMGNIHAKSDYELLIRSMKLVKGQRVNQDIKLFIVREPEYSHFDMNNILKLITKNNLHETIVIIKEPLDFDETLLLYKRADICITAFNEAPISHTLLYAMSKGKAIISTPYKFAIENLIDSGFYSDDINFDKVDLKEMVDKNRGIIVPFNDPVKMMQAILELFDDPLKRNNLGQKAREFALKMEWSKVAKSMYDFISKGIYLPLINDIFKNDKNVAEAEWNDDKIVGFDQIERKINIQDGYYVIYCDDSTQVNGKILDNKIFEIGIRQNKVVGDAIKGDNCNGTSRFLEEFIFMDNYNHLLFYKETYNDIRIEEKNNGFLLLLQNIKLKVNRRNNKIIAKFSSANRYASALGIIGQTLRTIFDSYSTDEIYEKWSIIDGLKNIFSIQNPHQRFDSFGLSTNFYHTSDQNINHGTNLFSSFGNKNILMFEGPVYHNSGFTNVNRKMFLGLKKYNDLEIVISPTDLDLKKINITHFETYLVNMYYQDQAEKVEKLIKIYNEQKELNNNFFVFRCNYPPNFDKLIWGSKLILHMPWDYVAFPSDWVKGIKKMVNELWVPSQYCKDSFVKNGIDQNIIKIVPYGADNIKSNLFNAKEKSRKTLKLLHVAGLWPRKGTDIMIKAYGKAFTKRDKVVLTVHANKGDDFKKDELKNFNYNNDSPKLALTVDDKSESEILKLFKSHHFLLSPYRSEGFGLTIFEGMANGLVPIVTDYASSKDFCSAKSCFLIKAEETTCDTYPCAYRTIFGFKTAFQALWAEPSKDHLIQILKDVYAMFFKEHRQYLNFSHNANKVAEKYDWLKVINLMHFEMNNFLKKSNRISFSQKKKHKRNVIK